jgi:hypothetical protein
VSRSTFSTRLRSGRAVIGAPSMPDKQEPSEPCGSEGFSFVPLVVRLEPLCDINDGALHARRCRGSGAAEHALHETHLLKP